MWDGVGRDGEKSYTAIQSITDGIGFVNKYLNNI
jgi:hypothetical protein